MKTVQIISFLMLLTTLTACSSIDYTKLACNDLHLKEKSLIRDVKINSVGSIINGIGSIIDDSTKATVDSIVADQELKNSKDELHQVQSVIKQKRCKR
jgi:hypothetical protein